MECDIIFNIAGIEDNGFTIGREESDKQLSSLSDIAEFIINNWDKSQRQKFLNTLQSTKATIKDSNNFFKGRNIIGNISLDTLRYNFPIADEILSKIPEESLYEKNYTISLIDKFYAAGTSFSGRVSGFEIVSHIIRNQYDAERFAKAALVTYLAEKEIVDGIIQDEYLNNKYQSKLKNILTPSIIKKIKQNLKSEVKDFDENTKITILDLVLDFINHKSDYNSTEIKLEDSYLDVYSILNEFCLELQGFNIINEDSETSLSKRLKTLDYKRESFGKKELYDTILKYGTPEQAELLKQISIQDFIDADLDTIRDLLDEIFKSDVLMSRFRVTSVDKTIDKPIKLGKNQIKALIKKKNEMLSKSERKSIDNIISVEDAEQFFGNGFIFTDESGKNHPVLFKEENDELIYYYIGKKLTDNDKITFEKRKSKLIDEYDISENASLVGYDTKSIFIPVTQEDVVDGSYKGYYIYQHEMPNGNSEFIISKSVYHPNLYNPIKVSSLKDAKLTIDNFNRTIKIKDAADIELKKKIGYVDSTDREVAVTHHVFQLQTIPSIQYRIKKGTKLTGQEHKLFNNSTMQEVQDFYKNTYGIDLSKLDTPEKIGIFLYAMVENGYTIESLNKGSQYKSITYTDPVTGKEEQKQKYTNTVVEEDVKEGINQIIEDINNPDKSPVVNFLVERWHKSEREYRDGVKLSTPEKVNIVYLRSLNGYTINSIGRVKELNDYPDAVISAATHNLKDYLNETLFEGNESVISMNIDEILKDSELGKLFGSKDSLNGVKSFVHNNKIYLVNNSNASVNDLIHEVFHLLLGSIRAKDFDLYKLILESVYLDEKTKKIKPRLKGIAERVNKSYSKFAEIDRIEEIVVRSLARNVENDVLFMGNEFNSENKAVLDLIVREFGNLNARINKKFKQLLNDTKSDISFESAVKLIHQSNVDEMTKQRQIANFIKKGIEEGIIEETDC